MLYRVASVEDCPRLAALNAQLIQDEGHRNPMTIAQLEDRMREWLLSGEYQALLWEDNAAVVAYALFRDTATEVYLRQFFVVRHRRREGIGRQAIEALCPQVWSRHKRWTVSVLVQRFRDHGRLAPEGLHYVSSWVTSDLTTCYQLMECDDRRLLEQWMARWHDLVDFEVIPVITSAQAAERVASRL